MRCWVDTGAGAVDVVGWVRGEVWMGVVGCTEVTGWIWVEDGVEKTGCTKLEVWADVSRRDEGAAEVETIVVVGAAAILVEASEELVGSGASTVAV